MTGRIKIFADKEALIRPEQVRLAAGTLVCGAALIFQTPPALELGLFIISYLIIGGSVILHAVGNIRRGRIFDENFLMTIATFGAFFIREYPEAVAVMLFYQIGEIFQELAVGQSHRSIRALLESRPDYANLLKDGVERRVAPADVEMGEVIIIKPGERVPLDGIILAGSSWVDTSAITGEAIPRGVKTGEPVLSGFVNTGGLLKVEVTNKFGQSTMDRIVELVQYAGLRKANTEKYITKFACYYTPAVVAAAIALAVIPPLTVSGALFADWFYRALVFLVISCPCALVVSVPLSFFAGLGKASRSGILVKGANFLEALNDIETVVFDKTGTLTKGVFKVSAVVPADGLSSEQLLEAAAFAEAYSPHPIAGSILEAYGQEIEKDRIEDHEEIAGLGIKAIAAGNTIHAGNSRLMNSVGIEPAIPALAGTIVHMAIDGRYAGYLQISDEIKEDSASTIRQLKAHGVKNVVMLTGDAKQAAAGVAAELGLDSFYAELLPEHKLEKIEEIYRRKGQGSLVFVGDGINDAPVIARADVGIAMGGLGSAAAIEAADIVIMNDEPSGLLTVVRIAQRTRRIIRQNIVFVLAVKASVLALGAFGAAAMWAAVFADVGVTLIAVLNAMRILRPEKANAFTQKDRS